MAKPGPKSRFTISQEWNANLAYAIGLITTDGCMATKSNLIDLTSKDEEQLLNYSKCLGIGYPIGKKTNGPGGVSSRVQFKNIVFYDFLLSIGLTPAKSLTLGPLKIPGEYFFDFLRGCFDGDGCSYSYWDPRWKSSFMFYVSFTSGSIKFVSWLRSTIFRLSNLQGHLSIQKMRKGKNPYYQLRYSKYEAIKLVKLMYKNKDCIKLSRKYLKIKESLDIVHKHKGRVFVR